MPGAVGAGLLTGQEGVGGEEIEGFHKGGSLRGHAVAQNGGVVKVHLGEVVGVGFLPGTFGHGEKEGTDHQGLVLQMGQLLVNGVGALGQGLAVGPFQPGGEPAVLRSLKGDPALGGVRGVAVENFRGFPDQTGPVGEFVFFHREIPPL